MILGARTYSIVRVTTLPQLSDRSPRCSPNPAPHPELGLPEGCGLGHLEADRAAQAPPLAHGGTGAGPVGGRVEAGCLLDERRRKRPGSAGNDFSGSSGRAVPGTIHDVVASRV